MPSVLWPMPMPSSASPTCGGGRENGRFDCSGLTMRAWEAAGVALPHNSAAQYASAGPHIDDPSQVLPGIWSTSPTT